ncbi:MAG TPA: hypothetical protein VHC47_09910 [Mucilaginibacter sp.]|nr:hypothetical protein [Mucilaginibacter sp.]
MHTLHTVYDFKDATMHQTYLLPLCFGLIGLYILAYSFGLTTYYIRDLLRFKTRRQAVFFGVVFAALGIGISLLVYNDQNETFNEIKKVYDTGKYLEVEGRVRNYHPSEDQMHDNEHFDVDSVHFSFLDDITYSYGYTRSRFSNTAIRPNLYVRIKYYRNGHRNIILKLETE